MRQRLARRLQPTASNTLALPVGALTGRLAVSHS